jgi:hypothetical protein
MIRLPCRPVRYVPLALAAAVLLVPAAPASATAPVVDLDCTITVTTYLHPGFTPQLQHIAVISNGLTGTATCAGTIDGATVTGPGAFAESNQIVGNCFETTGTGTFVLKLPTTGGAKTVTGQTNIVGTRDLSDPETQGGTLHTGDLTGIGTVISYVGDCVTTPTTSATMVLTVHVT